jgi:hypothetical protein
VLIARIAGLANRHWDLSLVASTRSQLVEIIRQSDGTFKLPE